MGNHQVGIAMGRAAAAWWTGRGDAHPPNKAEALAVLDRICGPHRGADAEFEAHEVDAAYDDYTEPNGPIGRLVAIAFDATPECFEHGWDGDEDDEGPWYGGPHAAFGDRYEFC